MDAGPTLVALSDVLARPVATCASATKPPRSFTRIWKRCKESQGTASRIGLKWLGALRTSPRLQRRVLPRRRLALSAGWLTVPNGDGQKRRRRQPIDAEHAETPPNVAPFRGGRIENRLCKPAASGPANAARPQLQLNVAARQGAAASARPRWRQLRSKWTTMGSSRAPSRPAGFTFSGRFFGNKEWLFPQKRRPQIVRL